MHFISKELHNGITLIEDYSATKMYLIEGEEKAVLIDTGVGFCGLKEYIAELTSLPVQVLITHGHFDHAGGVEQFEEICISPEDLSLLAGAYNKRQRLDYTKGLCEKHCSPDSIKEEDFSDTGKKPVIYELANGMEFDLGNRKITAIAMPGHTKGTFAFYDNKTKSMFLGDACNPSSYLFLDESVSIERYLKAIKKLEEWVPQIQQCYFEHDYGTMQEEGPSSIITDVRECCERIMERTDSAIPFSRNLVESLMKEQPYSANPLDQNLMRLDGKLGNVIYSLKKIYESEEQQEEIKNVIN